MGISIAEQVRAAVPGTLFALEQTTGCAREVDFPSHPDDRAERFRGDSPTSSATRRQAPRRHDEIDPEEFWRRVEEVVGEQVVTTWSSSFALVEISAAGVTKATTLATLAAELGVVPTR